MKQQAAHLSIDEHLKQMKQQAAHLRVQRGPVTTY